MICVTPRSPFARGKHRGVYQRNSVLQAQVSATAITSLHIHGRTSYAWGLNSDTMFQSALQSIQTGAHPCRAHKSDQDKADVQRQENIKAGRAKADRYRTQKRVPWQGNELHVCVCVCVCVCSPESLRRFVRLRHCHTKSTMASQGGYSHT